MSRNLILTQSVRYLNSLSGCITKTHRLTYSRIYPTVIVQSDGSTIRIRYHEPRKIIKLPLDVWTLSESERKARIESRKPRKIVQIEDEVEDHYDSNKYVKYLKKK